MENQRGTNLISATKNWTKRNTANANSGLALQDIVPDNGHAPLTITKCALVERNDFETGELKEVGILMDEDNQYYSTISPYAIEQLAIMAEIIDEEGKVSIEVCKRKSKGERHFLSITILD